VGELILEASHFDSRAPNRHVLMLQIANAFFKLPGDYLKPGEEEVQGMRDRLNQILAPLDERGNVTEGDWDVGDCIAQWWRPNFETFMVS
jgi:cleavage and polyadenylation specificity factor subunit 5